MKKVAITGLSGAIGQILSGELSSDFQIFDLYHSKKYSGSRKILKHFKIDLLDKEMMEKVLDKIRPDVIIHMAAVTHIDVCEKDKERGREGVVWKTNVEGTDEIAKYCTKSGALMIFLSTECVFDGKKEFFDEKSKKNPINWYGVTKDNAEEAIISSGAKYAIIRSVVAYHKNDKEKTIYGKILHKLKSKESILTVYDQKFTPTYTYDIVKAINKIMSDNLTGIFHVAPKQNLSPNDLAKLIAKRNKIPQSLVKKTTLLKYYGLGGAALRLNNSSLRGKETNKILGFTPISSEEAL